MAVLSDSSPQHNTLAGSVQTGTGLSLTIVKALAKHNCDPIDIQSVEGVG
jgi:hypothetical protein